MGLFVSTSVEIRVCFVSISVLFPERSELVLVWREGLMELQEEKVSRRRRGEEVEEEEMSLGFPLQRERVVVGYALTSKKIKSFLQPKLEGLARYNDYNEDTHLIKLQNLHTKMLKLHRKIDNLKRDFVSNLKMGFCLLMAVMHVVSVLLDFLDSIL